MTHVPAPDHIRQHWDSVIKFTVMRHAALLNMVPWGEQSLAKLPPLCHRVIVKLCADLLERACRAQVEHPKASGVIESRINGELWNALKVFKPADASAPGQIPIDLVTTTRELQTHAKSNPEDTAP